jgi:hypothetical protein
MLGTNLLSRSLFVLSFLVSHAFLVPASVAEPVNIQSQSQEIQKEMIDGRTSPQRNVRIKCEGTGIGNLHICTCGTTNQDDCIKTFKTNNCHINKGEATCGKDISDEEI